jgi:hypothetical protein
MTLCNVVAHSQLASKLQEMREVLQSLSCVPDYDARKAALSAGEERLRAMVAPMLLDAFAAQDLGV